MGLRDREEFLAKTGQEKRCLLLDPRREIDESLEGGESTEEDDVPLHFLEKPRNLLGLRGNPSAQTILGSLIQQPEGVHCPVPAHHCDRNHPEQTKGDDQLGLDGKPAKDLVDVEYLEG